MKQEINRAVSGVFQVQVKTRPGMHVHKLSGLTYYTRGAWDSGVTARSLCCVVVLATERRLLDNCSCVVLPTAIPGLVVISSRHEINMTHIDI